jgi:hypothetical protein
MGRPPRGRGHARSPPPLKVRSSSVLETQPDPKSVEGGAGGVSVGDEKCLLAMVSGVAGIEPIRLVATNIRVNVVRMWSAESPPASKRSSHPARSPDPQPA